MLGIFLESFNSTVDAEFVQGRREIFFRYGLLKTKIISKTVIGNETGRALKRRGGLGAFLVFF